MVSQYVHAKSINELLPVTICSGTGTEFLIPDNQADETSAGIEIRNACVAMGFAAGASGRPITGKQMNTFGIPNTYSLAWRLGRVVARAQQEFTLGSVTDMLIEECGGIESARLVFQGKIRSVESSLTSTAHTMGKVIVEALGEGESEVRADTTRDEDGEGLAEIHVPFMNENLALVGKYKDGTEKVSLLSRNPLPPQSRYCPL